MRRFSLYLKGRFNLMCFDEEHPSYPDHDNFFITEDNMILVEYDGGFELSTELKSLLRYMYDGLGVNEAWATLFKNISDSFTLLQEEEYGLKKARLHSIGMVDYYDALPFLSVFKDNDAIHRFIDTKKGMTGEIDPAVKKELNDPWEITSWKQHSEKILEEFLVAEEARRDFLLFDFTRLVNANLILKNVMKMGSLAVNRVGHIIQNRLSLGFMYTKKRLNLQESLFNRFTFSDFYKVGSSLIIQEEKSLKNALVNTPFGKDNSFLGTQITKHLMESFDDYLSKNLRGSENILSVFETWINFNKTIIEITPYVLKFHQTFKLIVKKQQIQDSFYINFKVSEMDFEALLVSNFVNFTLGHKGDGVTRKLAVSVREFKKFYNFFFDGNGKLKSKEYLQEKIEEFAFFYGLDRIFMFSMYFTSVLDNELVGYRPSELKKADFRYVGGPIIFDDREENLAHLKNDI